MVNNPVGIPDEELDRYMAMTDEEFRKCIKEFDGEAVIVGDILKMGNAIMRKSEANTLRDEGFTLYSAGEEKDINDKTKQSVESNNTLAERIYKKDMDAIRKARIIFADIDNDSIGSICEVASIGEHNKIHKDLVEILKSDNVEEELKKWVEKYPYKQVYFHNTDIRNTEIPEKGMRRSYSINAFLYGLILALNPNGFEKSFTACVKKAKDFVVKFVKKKK